MTTTRRMLAAVDFGDASARAVEVAGAIARHWPAVLHLLHAEAQEAPVYFTHEQVEALAAQRERLQAQAIAFLDRFGRRHTSCPFEARLDHRPPTDAIVEHARGADLVVMGTHGRRGPSRWWLGSVAERVARAVDGPLLIVHADDAAESVFSRVCVCAEGVRHGDRALGLAHDLARLFGGVVTDRRDQPLPSGPTEEASLVVIGVPATDAHLARAPFSLSQIRSGRRAVLLVPEAATAVPPPEQGG